MVDESHIELATKIAQYSDIIKARMSAIALTKSGKVICTASNRRLQGDFVNWSRHAEEALVMKLLKLKAFDRYKNITIFVFRISIRGVSMAKPCPKCQKILAKYDVKVLYTTDSGEIKCLA